ncbi:MAG TPA: hypothetical protein VH855_07070 [Acetobacteraceae bacterium]
MLQRVLHAPDARASRFGGSNPALRRGAAISAAVHVAVLLLLLVGLPTAKPQDEQQEVGVAMVFDGTAESSVKAPAPGPVPAPANVPDVTPAPAAQQPPKPQPIEASPPPPPPPAPPPPQATALALPTPPLPVPPPTPSPAPAVSPPPAAPPTPAQTEQPLPTPPLPVPPPPTPTPSPRSATSQPNPTRNPAPESTALDNTLEKLRSRQPQSQPPRARYNPQSGGAPNGGGNPNSDDTAGLSAAQRGAIGDYVRRCWSTDPDARDLDKMQVLLTVTTDTGGVVRRANVADEDASRVTRDPILRAFSERAVRAVLDPNCANLPLPPTMLGQVRTFTFRFRP